MSVTDLTASGIITNKSLQGYFFDSVNDAVHNQRIDTSDEIIIYLVNLLTTFSRSEDLFHYDADGVSLKPLALMYSDAMAETRPSLRIRILQKLGDTALFISGVFSDSLNTRLVDMDYYVAMGGNAYACISDNLRHNQPQASAQQSVYEELKSKFIDFVDVLSEVTKNKSMLSNHDIMRLYEVWMRTGSKRTAAILQQLGIDLVPAASLQFNH